jgi:hypothetical protein
MRGRGNRPAAKMADRFPNMNRDGGHNAAVVDFEVGRIQS